MSRRRSTLRARGLFNGEWSLYDHYLPEASQLVCSYLVFFLRVTWSQVGHATSRLLINWEIWKLLFWRREPSKAVSSAWIRDFIQFLQAPAFTFPFLKLGDFIYDVTKVTGVFTNKSWSNWASESWSHQWTCEDLPNRRSDMTSLSQPRGLSGSALTWPEVNTLNWPQQKQSVNYSTRLSMQNSWLCNHLRWSCLPKTDPATWSTYTDLRVYRWTWDIQLGYQLLHLIRRTRSVLSARR